MDRYYKKRFVPLALPALILFVMVIVIPFIMGVIYSFTAWRGTYFAGGDHFWEAFVGFDNYVKAFKTKKFLDAFVYTIKVTLVAVVAINVVSLAMALLATSLNKGAAAYRTIYFLPNLLGGLALGYIWQFILKSFFQDSVRRRRNHFHSRAVQHDAGQHQGAVCPGNADHMADGRLYDDHLYHRFE